jgi:hypothetical protein
MMQEQGSKEVEFVGEQEGFVEEELKNSLHKYLSGVRGIRTAYLARVGYGPGQEAVALCLRAWFPNRARIVDGIGRVFSATFRRDQHMDILFISSRQEKCLQKVCSHFYRRKGLW